MQMIPSCQEDQYGCLDILNVKICPLVQILKTKQDVARSLVPILATRELVAPLATNPIMSERLILLLRHLKHQNMSTSDDFIDSSGKIFLVQFLATKEALASLAYDPIMLGISIWLFKHLECQNPSIISDSID